MTEIKNVAILGAGAMGAFFAARFASAQDLSIVLIADESRARKLKQDGLIINEKQYYFPVVVPENAAEPVDLMIVALKHHQLAPALNKLDRLVGPNTLFISVMNGLESESIIASKFGSEKVLYAISIGIDAVREGNNVTYTRPGKHIFGEAKNTVISEKVLRVQRAFTKAGIQFETPEDMLRMMWWKFMVNVGVNQASAVLRAPYGVFHQNQDAQALMDALMSEVVELAQASQINLTRQDVLDWYPVLKSLSPEGKTSMLQDVEAGRQTEVDVFGGKVVSLGKSLGITTPVNQTIVQIIRVIENSFRPSN
jgi:2-dehydropantoate 2-reductase